MADTILFDNGTHRNILLEDSGSAGMCGASEPAHHRAQWRGHCCSIRAGTRSIAKF